MKNTRKWTRLIEARKRMGFTQSQLAQVCGVAKSTYVRWESLLFEPSLAQIKTISYLLKVPVDWLIGNTEFDCWSDYDYWSNVRAARDYIRQQLENPQSFLRQGEKYVDTDSIISWVSDKLGVPVDYFDASDLLPALPDELHGVADDMEEAGDYFPIIPIKLSNEELTKARKRKK